MHDLLATAYTEHAAVLSRFVRGQVRNEADAEDIMATVWLNATQALARGHQPKFMRAWLYAIARNAVVNHYRSQTRLCTFPLEDEEAVDAQDMAHLVESRLLAERMHTAHILTNAQRAVLRLRFVDGYSAAETAAQMGMTVGAVKALQNRACVGLRALVGAD